MAGIRDLLPLLPPVLLTASITNTSNSNPQLSTVRILGSDDPTYGTASDWTPPLDAGSLPFGIIQWLGTTDDMEKEANRVHVTAHLELFIAIAHTDTPDAVVNYIDLELAWDDEMRKLIASKSKLSAESQGVLDPSQAGDIWWIKESATPVNSHSILGTTYAGIQIPMSLWVVIPVNYQY